LPHCRFVGWVIAFTVPDSRLFHFTHTTFHCGATLHRSLRLTHGAAVQFTSRYTTTAFYRSTGLPTLPVALLPLTTGCPHAPRYCVADRTFRYHRKTQLWPYGYDVYVPAVIVHALPFGSFVPRFTVAVTPHTPTVPRFGFVAASAAAFTFTHKLPRLPHWCGAHLVDLTTFIVVSHLHDIVFPLHCFIYYLCAFSCIIYLLFHVINNIIINNNV